MKDWSEDNFLERLMPYLKPGDQAGAGACPDPETLSAFAEGTLASKKRNAVQIHLDECHACAQLCDRLKDFGASSVAVSEAEWQNAEKRLDNWTQRFLRAGSTRTTRSNNVQPVYSWWNPKHWLQTPRLGYALVATLSVALAIGITMFGVRRQGARPQVASVDHQGTATNSETGQTGTQAEGGKQEPSAALKPNPATSIPLATTARAVTPGNGSSENDIVPLKGEPMQAQVPLAPTPAQTSRPDQVFSELGQIQIQVGTGMLLTMDSVTSQPDGRFVFRGRLSQPLVQDGRTVLPTNSLVVGSGMVSGGQTSVWVSEIQSSDIPTGTLSPPQNRHYALKATGARPNVRISSPLPGGRLAPGETFEARFVISSSYVHEVTPLPRVWEVPKQR